LIILDTNVLSELMRPAPARKVIAWFAEHPASGLYTTTLTVAEVLTGIALLPRGKRRAQLDLAARKMFEEDLDERCLPFDALAAAHYAGIFVARQRAGRPIAAMDAQIAAIAQSRGAALVTRKLADFAGCGLDLIDPWA
jgi:predicted nucleic acid-binding protein